MKFSTTSFAAGAVAALVIGSGTAYAATGGSFILGKANSAGATTTLSNANGTALTLNSKAGTPSLRVNRTTKVPNLNADLIDGLDSSSFARSTGKTGTIWSDGGIWLDLDEPADGNADALFAFAECPPGTVLTGGGGEDDTAGGTLWLSESIDTGVWAVASSTAPASETIPDLTPSDEIFATAQCYNPKGAVPGALYRAKAASPLELLKQRAAAKQQ